jgi:hypothetical protein
MASYTDIDTVKKLLQSMPTIFNNIQDEKITFNDFDKSYLQYTNIDVDSEIVKIIRTVTLTNDNPTLTDNTEINLSGTFIVPNTVVVADSLTLTTIYVENKDYIINYTTGKISRTTVGSSITNPQTVYVWYIPYVQLTDGSDYNTDDDEGSLNRRAGTSIPDKATVYVDYSHSQGNVPDDLIAELILETDSIINNVIKATEVDSTDKALNSAATNFVMYLICLSQSQKILKLSRTISDDVGEAWIKLADSYLSAANKFLAFYKFSPTFNPGKTVINEDSTFGSRKNTRFSAGKSG